MDKHIEVWKPMFQAWVLHTNQRLQAPHEEFEDVMAELTVLLDETQAKQWMKAWADVKHKFIRAWQSSRRA